MTEKIESLRTELSEVPKFQWIKTERLGEISYYKDVVDVNGTVFVEFNDGSRVNYNLLGDVVLKITDDSMLIDAALDLPSNAPTHVNGVSINKTAKTAVNDSPIRALLKKQKPNPVGIDISIELNLPSVNLYNVLNQSFENANAEIVDFIVADLDINVIKDAVKDAILKFYQQEDHE